MQTRHWCFTVNNWNAADENHLIALGGKVSYLVFGYETAPVTGTPHLQGYVIFPKVKRFNEARTLLPGGSHIEKAKGKPAQAAIYCKKDGLFKEYGEVPLCGSGGQFSTFVEWVLSYHSLHGSVPCDRHIAREFPALFVRYSRKLRELAIHTCPQPRLLEDCDLRDWQQALEEAIMDDPPDDRSILFYVDVEGGQGKSFFQRYLLSNHPNKVQVLSAGKRDDIAHAVDEHKSIFLFNIPRNGMEFFNYTIIEQLKDRMVFSPKYESRTKILMQVPHVVVFCNEMPNMTKMTADRFKIIELDN